MTRALASLAALVAAAALLAPGCATPIEIPYADGGISANTDRGGGSDSAVSKRDYGAVPDMVSPAVDGPFVTPGGDGGVSLADAAADDAGPSADGAGGLDAVPDALGDAEPGDAEPLGDAGS